jgi:hypothetical protein
MLKRDLQMWICLAFRGWSWFYGIELMDNVLSRLSRQALFMIVPLMLIRFW